MIRTSGLPLFMFIGIFLISSVSSRAITLSQEAEISLLTASPGNELYSVFGHSAMRVMDSQNNLDIVFNYGTFDFDTPNFYLKFVRGQLLYKLSVTTMEYFMLEYEFDGRAVYEQILELTQDEKQDVFDFMRVNSLPENAYYQYDFFYDNCATRIRDLIHYILEPEWFPFPGILPESLAEIRSMLDYEFEYEPSFEMNRTLRDMLQPFLTGMPWSTFGIDLALGLPADKIATPWDFMYLPDEMLIAFALARRADGLPLVKEHRLILQCTTPITQAGFFTPNRVIWFVFIIALASFITPGFSRIFDLSFFTILGITGIVILFLWFLTDHLTTKSNMNILWAIPTHLYFIWVSNYKHIKATGTLYFRIVSAISFFMLILWPFIPQGFNSAFYPIVLASFIKSLPYAFEVPFLSTHLTGLKRQ
ncbi:MAG: DUF4105 domain-containing protein [Bacteroidetes bacterium]|nr:MAG: DUF4105 domain-containing protein [Bacteroidota bacterium]